MAEVKKLPKRSEIKVEDTWRTEDIFATDADWVSEYEALKDYIPALEVGKGNLGQSAARLALTLHTRDQTFQRLGKLYVYASLKHDEDTTNPTYQGKIAQAKSLYTEAASLVSYIAPEILEIEPDVLANYIAENEDLQAYKQSFDEINKMRPHVLTADKEALLASANEVMGASANTFAMLNNADMKFPIIKDEAGNDVQLTHGNYITFLESQNRDVREAAFKACMSTYKKYESTFASTLVGGVKQNNFYAKIKNFKSARHRALANNHIPESVYDTLVETVNENLPLLHRYYELRRKVMGLEELRWYDTYVPMLSETKMTVTYEEARELVTNSLKIMGEEYSDIVKEGFSERWVDVRENEGKRSGAYSSGTYGTAPYILMNWQDDVGNMFTLTHEFGHSVHSYLSRKYQPYHYSGYSIFVAEVASTVNEALLNHHLLEKSTDIDEQLYLINNFLDGFRGTVFRQVMFAEFEQLIHEKDKEGIPLTAENLSTWYFELNQKYFGEGVALNEEIRNEWARIPHFYYNFYVYQYATGYAAAQALFKQIMDEGKPAARRVMDFLKAGSSDYPTEVLKKAGVDMTKKEPIEDAMKVFEAALDKMEELLAKSG